MCRNIKLKAALFFLWLLVSEKALKGSKQIMHFPRPRLVCLLVFKRMAQHSYLETYGELFRSIHSLSKLEPVHFNDSGFKFAELS